MADLKISQLTGATTPLAGTEVLPIVQSSSTVKVTVANLTAGRAISALSCTFIVGTYAAFPAVTVAASSETSRAYRMGMITGGKWALYESIGPTKLIDVDSTGNTSFYGGNLIPATAGKGIDFSANTSAAGMTSELLNWYEEGSWTPTLTCSDGNFNSVTYDALRGGSYTRVGKIVHVQCYMRTDAVDNSVGRTGDVFIAGLPFTAVSGVGGTLSGHSSLAVSVASTWAGDEPIGAFISGGDNNIQLMSRLLVNGNTSNITATAVGTGANANIVLIGGTYLAA